MISSAVLMSNDFDEIDFEFSGNNFGDTASTGKGQNNYFGKGVTGNYDRGSWFNVVDPQGTFHTYTIDWTPEKLIWEVGGVVVRTLLSSAGTTKQGSAYHHPQTPSEFQLGIWAGGDPGQNSGTKAWAGGTTDVSAAPYTMYVKNVKIENNKPAWAYNWTDQSGTWQSIDLLQEPIANVSSSMAIPSSTTLSQTSSSSSSAVKPSSASSTGKITSSSSSNTVKSTTSTSKSTSTPSSSKLASSSTSVSSSVKTSTTSSPSSPSTKSSSLPVTTTTKPKTTTTKCTTIPAPKTTTTTGSYQWQWGQWGSWWRSHESDGDDGNWDWQRHQKG